MFIRKVRAKMPPKFTTMIAPSYQIRKTAIILRRTLRGHGKEIVVITARGNSFATKRVVFLPSGTITGNEPCYLEFIA